MITKLCNVTWEKKLFGTTEADRRKTRPATTCRSWLQEITEMKWHSKCSGTTFQHEPCLYAPLSQPCHPLPHWIERMNERTNDWMHEIVNEQIMGWTWIHWWIARENEHTESTERDNPNKAMGKFSLWARLVNDVCMGVPRGFRIANVESFEQRRYAYVYEGTESKSGCFAPVACIACKVERFIGDRVVWNIVSTGK
jgi:hypothetical protein